MSEEGPCLIREGLNELCWVEVLGRYTLQCSIQVDLVFLRQIDRISIPACSKDSNFSKVILVQIKRRRLPLWMLFRSFWTVAQPSMNGVLSAFCNCWHCALQLWSEHVIAVSCSTPWLISEEHMEQNTRLLSIGCSPGIVSTSPQRSNNFEGSQILFQTEVRKYLQKDETKVSTECEKLASDGICKCMVMGEIDKMREWYNAIMRVYNVIELGDMINLVHGK